MDENLTPRPVSTIEWHRAWSALADAGREVGRSIKALKRVLNPVAVEMGWRRRARGLRRHIRRMKAQKRRA